MYLKRLSQPSFCKISVHLCRSWWQQAMQMSPYIFFPLPCPPAFCKISRPGVIPIARVLDHLSQEYFCREAFSLSSRGLTTCNTGGHKGLVYCQLSRRQRQQPCHADPLSFSCGRLGCLNSARLPRYPRHIFFS